MVRAMTRRALACGLVAVALGGGRTAAERQYVPSPADQEHRAIFKELVEINTSPQGGSVAPAARAV